MLKSIQMACLGMILGTLSVVADTVIEGTVTYDKDHTGTVNIAENVIFKDGGVLNVDLSGTGAVTFSGAFSSETPTANGTLNFYSSSRGAFMNVKDFSGFYGTINIGNMAGKKDCWIQLGQNNFTGSEHAVWNIQTNTNSGIYVSTTWEDINLGTLVGTGLVRVDTVGSASTFHIGGLRTSTSDVDVFHGAIRNGTTNFSLEKTGAGTWLITNNPAKWENGNPTSIDNVFYYEGATTISSGVLQVGDYGHTYAAGDSLKEEGTVGDGASGAISNNSKSKVVLSANGTLRFARSNGSNDSLVVANAMEMNGGMLSNVHPDCAIELSGALTGTGFTKTGAGTVRITGNNTVVAGDSFAINVNEGTLQFGNGNSNSGNFLGDGTRSLNVASGATLAFHYNAGITCSIPVTINGGTLSCLGNSVTLSGNISGTGFTKTGTGKISLTGDNSSTLTNTAVITVREGTLAAAAKAVGNAQITLDGGTFQSGSSLPAVVSTDNGGVLKSTSNLVLLNLSGTGTVQLSNDRTASSYDGYVHLGYSDGSGGNLTQFTGTLQTTNYTWAALWATYDMSKLTFDLSNTQADSHNGIYVCKTGGKTKPFQIGNLTGTGFVETHVSRLGNNPVYFEVGSLNESGTFSGTFNNNTASGNTPPIYVTKKGDGTWTLGSGTSLAATTDSVAHLNVASGTVVLSRNAGVTAASDISVESGAGLVISAAGQEIQNDLNFASDSFLTFALTPNNATSGHLTVGGDLTFDDTAYLAFTTSEDFYSNIDNTTSLEFLDVMGTNTLTFDMIQNALEGTKLGHYFNLRETSPGVFTLQADSAALPEPSCFWLLLLGLGLQRFRNRYSRR